MTHFSRMFFYFGKKLSKLSRKFSWNIQKKWIDFWQRPLFYFCCLDVFMAHFLLGFRIQVENENHWKCPLQNAVKVGTFTRKTNLTKTIRIGTFWFFNPLWKKNWKNWKKNYRLERKKNQRVTGRLKIRKANINYFADTFIIFNPQL